MKSILSIIKADYLQRSRSYVFLITLLVSGYFAYTFIPAANASYTTMRIGNFVGYNNGAWIGHVTALMANVFLWMIGFYLINNGIKRDDETGVGQIIATTAISNFKYLLAKTISNFFVLLSIAFTVFVVALLLVVLRGGDYPFNIFQFCMPYLVATVPSLFFLSSLAVFFEIIFGQKTNLANISFFLIFIFMLNTFEINGTENTLWFDVLGNKFLTDELSNIVNLNLSKTHQEVSVGFIFGNKKSIQYFLFEGSHLSIFYIASRLFWIGMSIVLIGISAKLFNRFDHKAVLTISKKKKLLIEEPLAATAIEKPLISLVKARIDYSIFPLVKTELIMLFRKGPVWFWILNLGGWIALFFSPLAIAHQIILPILWFLQVNRWADIATKEKFYGTDNFIYGSYKPLGRLLTAQLFAGITMTFVFALPIILRYVLNADFAAAASVILGSFIVISLAICLGIVSGGKRLFEVFYFFITYFTIQKIPGFNFLIGNANDGSLLQIQLIIVTTLLTVAYLKRRFDIINQ